MATGPFPEQRKSVRNGHVQPRPELPYLARVVNSEMTNRGNESWDQNFIEAVREFPAEKMMSKSKLPWATVDTEPSQIQTESQQRQTES